MNQRDAIRRVNINCGPYQYRIEKYSLNGDKHPRKFQAYWYKMFPSWLEHYHTNDATY